MDNQRWPYFKVYDDRVNDPRFMHLSNSARGVYHWLECWANCQPKRWEIKINPPPLFWKTLEKFHGSNRKQLEKFFDEFQKHGLIDYSAEEGWIYLKYAESKQQPLSDADRAKRYRQRQSEQEPSRIRDARPSRKRKERKEKKEETVTKKEQIKHWVDFAKEIVANQDSAGLALILDKQLQAASKGTQAIFFEKIKAEGIEAALINRIEGARKNIKPLPG